MNKRGQEEFADENSNKKQIIIGGVIFLVVAIGIYFLVSSLMNNSDSEITEEISYLDSCLNNCGNCKQNCYDQDNFHNAQNSLDESICNGIKNEAIKSECIQEVIFIKAIQNKDSTICNTIGDEFEKERCISAVESSQNPANNEEEILE